LVEEAASIGIRLGYDGRIVVHHQINADAVQKLKDVLSRVMEQKAAGAYTANEGVQVNGGGYGSTRRLKRT
jgi:hypothetical protein